jgi:rod shape-determining protein MreC
MAVVAFYEGYQGLVGRIVEAGRNSAKMLPLYDRNFSVAARLQNLRYEGIVSGRGSTNSLSVMNYVNKNARDRIGYDDVVITSGMSSIYPAAYISAVSRSVGARE